MHHEFEALLLEKGGASDPVTVHIHARLHMHPSTELCISVACITNVCTYILCLRYLARDCTSLRENVLDYVYIDEILSTRTQAQARAHVSLSLFFFSRSRQIGMIFSRRIRGVLFRPRSTRSLSYRIFERTAPAKPCIFRIFSRLGEEIRSGVRFRRERIWEEFASRGELRYYQGIVLLFSSLKSFDRSKNENFIKILLEFLYVFWISSYDISQMRRKFSQWMTSITIKGSKTHVY